MGSIFMLSVVSLVSLASLFMIVSAEQCGSQAGNVNCPDNLCCSKWGWCGTTSDYCGDGCQSQCVGTSSPSPGGGDVSSLITRDMFNQMLKHRNDGAYPAKNFYTYDAFIAAAKAFQGFGTNGSDVATRKREIAAFLAQTSHETTVATDPTISFKTAVWFWMTPQSPKPSCHNVMIGNWQPSAADRAAGRVPGYGVVTNIINGGLECGHGQNARVADRIGFYKRYCDILGVGYGANLDCYGQRPFGSGFSLVDSI